MRKKQLAGILLFVLFLLTGCGNREPELKVVLTAGFARNEIFRIETMSCTLPEIMVYLTNTKDQYEAVYGSEIWETDLDGITLEENIKETVLAQLAQIKTMNLLANQHGVTLDQEEQKTAQAAAAAYFSTLNETEISSLQITEAIIQNMYQEYALANKVYRYIIKDINPEISDDEARTITVQHILFKTYTLDGTGKKIEYSETNKEEVYELAKDVLMLARNGENDFESLIMQYSEDEKGTYSFGKGEMEPVFEEAAFNLETGEISEIIETSFGYHIIKCINTFNREETDANKIKIVEKKREEVFGQEYEAFVKSLTRDLNEELWEKVSFLDDEAVNTSDFFEVYNRYFSE